MKKKIALFLVICILVSALCFAVFSARTMDITLRAGEISYVQIFLSPYRYDTNGELVTLHMDDPEESGIIHWLITEFSGEYTINSIELVPGQVTGPWWESLCFYDKDDQLLQKISWSEKQYDGIYLTPNPNSMFTRLYDNDIDWNAFYEQFSQYEKQ